MGLWLAVFLFIVVHLFGKKMLPAYLLLLFVSCLPINLASGNFSELSPTTEIRAIEKRKNYMSNEYLTQTKNGVKNKNWYVQFRFKYVLLVINILVLFLAVKNYRYLKNSKMVNLLMLGIVLIGVGQLLEWSIHSFRRYYMVGQMVILIPIVHLLSERKLHIPKFLVQNLALSIVIYLIVEFRVFFYSTTIDFLISNPIIAIFYKSQVSLNELIR